MANLTQTKCQLNIPKRIPTWMHLSPNVQRWHAFRPWIEKPEGEYYDWATGIRSVDRAHRTAHECFEELFDLSIHEVRDRHTRVCRKIREKLCKVFNRDSTNSIMPEQVVLGNSISELINLMTYGISLWQPRINCSSWSDYHNTPYSMYHHNRAKNQATRQSFAINADYPYEDTTRNERHLSQISEGTPIVILEGITRRGFSWLLNSDIMDCVENERGMNTFIFIDGAHVSDFYKSINYIYSANVIDAFFGSFGKYLGGEPLGFAILSERMLNLMIDYKDRIRAVAGRFEVRTGLGRLFSETYNSISLPELEAANFVLDQYLRMQTHPENYIRCLNPSREHRNRRSVMKETMKRIERSGKKIGICRPQLETGHPRLEVSPPVFRISTTQFYPKTNRELQDLVDEIDATHQIAATDQAAI